VYVGLIGDSSGQRRLMGSACPELAEGAEGVCVSVGVAVGVLVCVGCGVTVGGAVAVAEGVQVAEGDGTGVALGTNVGSGSVAMAAIATAPPSSTRSAVLVCWQLLPSKISKKLMDK
jgi:hypothetical protein